MITVVGSINMDLTVQTDIFPEKGETVLGQTFHTKPGGKGANQAIAAARLGGEVQLIGCVGKDEFGRELKSYLQNEKVNVGNVMESNAQATGIANITVHEGDNRIIVVPGANYDLEPEDIERCRDVIVNSKVVVVQLEIKPEIVEALLKLCRENNVKVIMDPAPSEYFDRKWLDDIDILTPNETECAEIFGANVDEVLEKYPNKLLVTLGGDGVRYYDGSKHITVSSFPAKVVDTTGAGDTFSGALAYALVQGYEWNKAILFGNVAASFTVESLGAQSGMPSVEQVLERLEEVEVEHE